MQVTSWSPTEKGNFPPKYLKRVRASRGSCNLSMSYHPQLPVLNILGSNLNSKSPTRQSNAFAFSKNELLVMSFPCSAFTPFALALLLGASSSEELSPVSSEPSSFTVSIFAFFSVEVLVVSSILCFLLGVLELAASSAPSTINQKLCTTFPLIDFPLAITEETYR